MKVSEFQSAFPEIETSLDAHDLKEYGRDWTKRFEPDPTIILFPKTTAQVSSIMKFCHTHLIAVVPSGGRTGLAGGAVASQREWVVSLAKMNQIGEIDRMARTVWAQAGAVTQAVHEATALYGLTWPVDFASKGSSQIGGNISTNAGGVRVIRYGLTRNWVLGLTVVLATGEILEINHGLEKNNTGLDLRQLFISTEGTLGIITEAVLKLAPLPKDTVCFFLACPSMNHVLELFRYVREAPFIVNAFETLSAACLKSCVEHMNNRNPFANYPPYSVLLEIERTEENNFSERLENWLGTFFEKEFVTDGVQSQSPEQEKDFWKLRENITESLTKRALVHKHDVSLPLKHLGEFCRDFDRLARDQTELEIFIFGHVGDGNLHINYLKPTTLDKAAFYALADALDLQMFALLQKYRGSVSAEHGIGLIKKSWLKFSKTPAEIALMKAVKRALDPQGILNPGKIFDL